MENENNQVLTNPAEEDSIMPDGWAGDQDFFSWATGVEKTDESSDLAAAFGITEDGSEESEEVPATDEPTEEADEPKAEETEEPPATQEESETKPTTFKFEANVNHKKIPVELTESELPELYETAYGAKKLRNKLNAKIAEQEKAQIVSELLGYSSVDEMLDAARKSYEDSEVEKLVNERVHPTIAKDTVARKIKELEDKAAKNRKPVEPEEPEATPTEANGRDFRPEVADLLKSYPELKGKSLPQEVIDACVQGGKPLQVAYAEYKSRQDKAELTKLRKENNTLKQNAEAAKRAPVRGVAKGGATNVGPEDPFIAGFGSY